MHKNSLRLRSKFFLSFGAVLMLGTLVAALMLVMMQRSSASYERVLQTDRRVAELALAIQANKLRISEALRGRLLHPYGDFGDTELEHIRAAYEQLVSIYREARQVTNDSELVGMLDQIENIEQQVTRPLEVQILDAINREESAEAESLYFDKYDQARTTQQQLLDQLNSLATQRITSAVEKTRSQASMVRVVAIALTTLLLFAGALLSYYLTRSFEKPIDKLMTAARAIVAGDLDQKLTLDRNDELGEMAEVLNQMVSHLHRLNDDLSDQVRWLRETKDELTQTQGQLIQQEKMAALGKLVAGVAHELNNPISFVYSNTILLKGSLAEMRKIFDFYDQHALMPEAIRNGAAEIKAEVDYDYLVKDIAQTLEDCFEGARRVRDIVSNLKTTSRLDSAKQERADITEGIESTIRLLGQYFRQDKVVLHREYGELPKIDCYPGQLSQVWMNLLVNAAQAMNSHGEMWITSRIEKGRAVIKIRDNGPGIPEEVITKIFDPFFTTKVVGEGTGLGLSIVHGIIERHGGEIRVESEVGVGTTFTIELPLVHTDAPAEPLSNLTGPIAYPPTNETRQQPTV